MADARIKIIGNEKKVDADKEDYAVRMRHADFLAAAGVGVDRIAIEVLYLLPPAFVREYTRVFHEALNIGEDGSGIRNEQMTALGKVSGANSPNTGSRGGSRMSSGGHTEIGSGTGRGGGSGKSRGIFGVRNEEKLGEKDAVDRVLRKLARKMKNDENGRAGGLSEGGRCGFDAKNKREMKNEWVEREGIEMKNWQGEVVGRPGKGSWKKTGRRIAAGCGKYTEGDWKYCPWCGWKKSGIGDGLGDKRMIEMSRQMRTIEGGTK